MKCIIRNRSIMTGKANLGPLYILKNFPVFCGCVNNRPEHDLRADMSWAICPETGMIQLDKLIPLEILYQAQHFDSTGLIWQQYYHDFADYIIKHKPKNILEIGGGRGSLAEIFINKKADANWTIVEPNPLYKGNKRIKVIPTFFDENLHYNNKIDMVILSHVMEHAYDPEMFLNNIVSFLKPADQLVFAYPNLKLWLQRKYTNALNFEHTMFLTDYFMDYLLIKHGFEITDKTFYKDHSVFYAAKYLKNPKPLPKLKNKYNEYKKIFMDFVNYHLREVNELNRKIKLSSEQIYLFGAHVFSQYLIQFGLQTNKIACILDNSPLKQGKRLYGTSLIVKPPQILKNQEKVNVILKAGVYNQEIKKDILENINNKVVFW